MKQIITRIILTLTLSVSMVCGSHAGQGVTENEIIIGSRYCAGGYMENQIHSRLSYLYNLVLKIVK